MFYPVDITDITNVRDKSIPMAMSAEAINLAVPGHVQELYDKALNICEDVQQRASLATLLRNYRDVLSSGERDRSLTNLVEHFIPVEVNSVPIRYAP